MNIPSQTSHFGLYQPEFEHDSCGVGLVANIQGAKTHAIVDQGLTLLENMEHRGAEGADSKSGDGAGILIQIPHEFILLQGIPVPEQGTYGTGLVFLPKDKKEQQVCLDIIKNEVEKDGLNLFHLRDVPTNSEILGVASGANEPDVKQVFITGETDTEKLELALYIIRKRIEKAIFNSNLTEKIAFHFPSLSSKRIIYKGMLTSMQVRAYYPDLRDPHFTSGLALVHSRFSTNTFPRWDLAQPFRMLGHNGEINTIKGNRFWMEARESVMKSDRLGDLQELFPVTQTAASDSASFDNVFEFLIMSGKSLPHALAMLVPESWNDKNPISDELKSFYEYHSILMEPWDGPAALLFSDGRFAGGMLDRNGLRPARYMISKNNTIVVASEAGVIPFAPEDIKENGRLQPGKMLMIDTQEGKVYYDAFLKDQLANEKPYGKWLSRNRIDIDDISSGRTVSNDVDNYKAKLNAFGYKKEDFEKLILPMAANGAEPVASMGNDTPLSVLSSRPYNLFTYFRQLFAQVTNPPIDPIREKLVMSLRMYVGAQEGNLLDTEEEACRIVKLDGPILNNTQFDILKNLEYKGFHSITLPALYKPSEGPNALENALDELCKNAEIAVTDEYNYIILSDRGTDIDNVAIPSLLAVAAVHHYLIKKRKRMQTALVVESAEPREIMHFALLTGYGASAINPYLAFAAINDSVKKKDLQLDYNTAEKNYIKSINNGLLKILSKMGISTLRSYRGAQIFEAIGIGEDMLNKYFCGTVSKIGGIDLSDVQRETTEVHAKAFNTENNSELLDNMGLYAYRTDGEYHAWNPETISALQVATRLGSFKKFKTFSSSANDNEGPTFLRNMMKAKKTKKSISIDKVEPASEITKRFVTGAMSFGSISSDAHEAIAIAVNKVGGKSNSGEGGEDPRRFKIGADGLNRRSAIKQIASGRFGVTTEYLVNADELQIKIAQGAKPGEGGHLPGFKVDQIIAKTRHTTPGISLISPPPHHDIYSIEDLAQLIYDLKNVNPAARVSVKLVSEAGVGTIAAGVAKAKADMILIAGCEGGTGASPTSSIKHAGLPMELGLAETQQTLVMNNLRGQVRLQCDGQLKTGRDIVIAAMLGAEEFGFATSALIVLGCVMMRKCHLNTCPMGIATQNEELKKRFIGKNEYLVNYFNFLAEEVREYLAEMGYTKLDDIVGHSELLEFKPTEVNEKAKKVDLSRVLYTPDEAKQYPRLNVKSQDHKIDSVLDRTLIKDAQPAIESLVGVDKTYSICNTDRTAGAMLSGEIAKKYGNKGFDKDILNFTFQGSAGQSFGAYLNKGTTFRLEGETNDYLGKGLSGGRIVIVPPKGSDFTPEENIIAGNTSLYGATVGEVFINGRVGERFCVRNSGAVAVVEGAGDHCCEYMTGGRTVVLGPTGRNFAAGMSGGVAYILDMKGNFDYFCNMEMVELSLIEDNFDNEDLQSLIKKHYQYTASPLAKRILDNWSDYVKHFIKVTPIEYKKILNQEKIEAIKKARS